MVHTRHDAVLSVVLRAHESKAVLALHIAKGRDMENLVGQDRLAILRLGQQITMALTNGVVHLGHDGSQAAIGAVRVPKAQGLEGMSQHARKSLQPDLACRVLNAFLVEQFVQPGQRAACFGGSAIAVVGIVKSKPCAAVDGQIGTAHTGLHAAHGQHQKRSRVGEGVVRRAMARVAHLTPTDERSGRFHAASLS